MLASIILPSYNHCEYVEQALESILENKINSMELLICDDGSSDGSSQIISAWLEKKRGFFDKVVFIKNQKNEGIISTLNELISISKGEVISGLASDDCYLTGGIAERVKILQSNPKWMGAFSDGVAIGTKNELYSESIAKASGFRNNEFTKNILTKTVISKWNEPMNLQFWRRSAFKMHGGEFEFDKSVFCEDLNFALWALSKNAFGYLDHQCVAYRYRTWPRQSSLDENEFKIRKKYSDMAFICRKNSKYFSRKNSKYLQIKTEYFTAMAHGHQKHANMLWWKLECGNNPIIAFYKKSFFLLKIKAKSVMLHISWWRHNWKSRFIP